MKKRITISVEPEVVEIAKEDVEAGRAPNVSAAIEETMILEKRRRGLRAALDMWEEEFGPISQEAKEWAREEMKRAQQEASSSMPER